MLADDGPLDPQVADHTTTDTLENLPIQMQPIQMQETTKYVEDQELNDGRKLEELWMDGRRELSWKQLASRRR